MKMTDQYKKYLFGALSLFFILLAFYLERNECRLNQEKQLIERFQKKMTEKELKLDLSLSAISRITSHPDFTDLFLSELAPYNQTLEKEGTGYLIYRNHKLFYWSDRAIAFRDTLPLSVEPEASVVFFPNGYYFIKSVKKDSLTIFGLILIKYNYAHENQYLKNRFYPDFTLPDHFNLIKAGSRKGFPIMDKNGKEIFTLIPQGKITGSSAFQYLTGILYLAGLIFLLLTSRKILSGMDWSVAGKLLATSILLFIIYWIHLQFHIPGLFNGSGFFSPSQFALNAILPSLGDFLFISFLFFYINLVFYWDIRIGLLKRETGLPGNVLMFLLLSFAAFVYGFLNELMGLFIYNSSFSFTLNRINEITVPTILGIASIMMLLFGLVLLSVRIADEARKEIKTSQNLLMIVLSPLIPSLVIFLLTKQFSFAAWILFLSVSLFSLLYASRKTRKYDMSYLVLFISIISVFSIYIIYHTTNRKEKEVQKLMADILVSEHDPAAEVFLVEIQQQINVDPNISKYLIPPFENLDAYLERTYFSGFFRQYDLQITICTGSDSVTIHPQNTKSPCYPFFDTMIQNQGMSIPGTNFYYMDNMDGRISYLGRIHYPLSSDSMGVSVFIDLKSKIQSEGIGFPELLIDNSMRKPASYQRFNYAKYFGGELVDRHGSYPYNYYIFSYNFEDSEYSYHTWEGYEHLFHRTTEGNYLIVSRSLYTFVDYLISFPYLFVVFFLSSLVVLALIQPYLRKNKIMFNLKFRIQAAIISIVFISLLLVALSTILYNLEEYKSRLQADLDQKMNSIFLEIDPQLENEKSITPEITEWLLPELVKLSNIFQTDINIYGVDGNLIASSRTEIFNRGLVSSKINTQAYYELFENFQTNYFQPEKIGELSYLSAYEPIINNSGDYLGFINLPYFTHQDKYSQEISTYVVAFINLYVLLFLASIVVAVFIANQITLPLVIIRENLRKIELGKRNEPINYMREDEIGKLVREYNKKVDELAASAELLARSERESAWREMAKQVAHEIKNPLTPMKLNIQHLQRFRGEGKEYHEYVNRISQTLIDQIDALSDIATEFSSFAQIPTAMKQVFNLSEQIGKVIELYENDERIRIYFNREKCGDIWVNADREQLSRALINLIKNGIQAIPEDRNGQIVLDLKRQNHLVIISVADNGSGISPELQEKMFSPNFTTKTSGMGLGLAIVKNIAENFNGRVWYETKPDEGTTFYLEIPVYDDPDSHDES